MREFRERNEPDAKKRPCEDFSGQHEGESSEKGEDKIPEEAQEMDEESSPGAEALRESEVDNDDNISED